MSVFYVKTAKVFYVKTPLVSGNWGPRPQTPGYGPPPFAKPWVHHCIWGRQFLEPLRAAETQTTPLIARVRTIFQNTENRIFNFITYLML